MPFLQRISDIFGGGPARFAKEAASHERHFNAGRRNRLNRNWPTIQTSMRADVHRGLRNMRARMRFLAKNSDHFKKFLSMYRNNIAGPYGMKLQVTGGTDAQNQHIENKFKVWCHREFASASHRLSFTQIIRRACTGQGRDGEVLIREIYGKNIFGYSLKSYDVAWLDETYNETLPSGNRVIMSVEIDEDERPVAYYLTPPPSDSVAFRNEERKRTRVLAAEIHHLYLPDDEISVDDTITRGCPPGHTASLTLFRLDLADEANLVSLQAGASKMGFITKKIEDGEEDAEEGQVLDKQTNERKPLINHFQAGIIEELNPGEEFTAFDPQFPNQNHGPFAKYMLRRIAAGLDVFYNSLTGDLEGVNLSSIRAGLLEEREVWKSLQEFFVEHFCRRVFINWLREAVLNGQVKISPRELDKFSEPKFQPRRWPWTDPLKDIQTTRLAIEAGLDTITDGLAEIGEDLQETFTKRRVELDLAAKLGIPLAVGAGSLAPGTLDAQGDEQTQPSNNQKAE
jgi:lambda family phage portal protein